MFPYIAASHFALGVEGPLSHGETVDPNQTLFTKTMINQLHVIHGNVQYPDPTYIAKFANIFSLKEKKKVYEDDLYVPDYDNASKRGRRNNKKIDTFKILKRRDIWLKEIDARQSHPYSDIVDSVALNIWMQMNNRSRPFSNDG